MRWKRMPVVLGGDRTLYSWHLLRTTSSEVGLLCLGKATAAPALGVQRRLGVEKGYPKTACPPPTGAATDNTLLSGMGGDNGPTEGLVGGRAGERGTKGLIHHACHLLLCPRPPTKSWSLCLPQDWVAQGTCVQGPALPPALLCVSSTSLSHLFSRLLKATSDTTCC